MTSRESSEDLPTPGGPVMPTMWAGASPPSAAGETSARSASVCARASGARLSIRLSAAGGGGEVTVAQALAELAAVCRGAGVGQAPTALSTPWRAATSPMMSRIIPLRFQSLGV